MSGVEWGGIIQSLNQL